jgi:MbtH protein
MTRDEDTTTRYRVVMNQEEQYSIWPAGRPLPPGWTDVGRDGTRQECLDHIGRVWTDMRPLSLRRRMS